MGCCMSMSSTNTEAPAGSAPEKHVGSIETRAPPPSVEEETVKEVLSETPKPKPLPKQEPIFAAEMKQDLLDEEEEEEEEEAKIFSAQKVEAFGKIQEKQYLGSNEEIMSQGSEICSVSISESVSTVTNVTDKRDNEEEEEEQEVRQRQRVMSRSPAKPPPTRNGFKRDRVMNQSPARRMGNNNGSALKGGPGRRDPGENFRRRSRSPATATRSSATMGQSPSTTTRRVNRSPGRVRSGPLENSYNGPRINSSRTMEGKWASNNNDDNNNNENCGTSETLENPLVSLECFIFL